MNNLSGKTLIPDDELHDVKFMLENNGRSIDEFDEIRAKELITEIPASLHRTVLVRHCKSGAKYVYQAGSGTDWIVEFAAHLTEGIFPRD